MVKRIGGHVVAALNLETAVPGGTGRDRNLEGRGWGALEAAGARGWVSRRGEKCSISGCGEVKAYVSPATQKGPYQAALN